MEQYKTISISIKDKVAKVILNRPEVHNAFNEVMISEITQAFKHLNTDNDVIVIILEGNGPSFCAGADINWMKGVSNYDYDQNLKESIHLSECFYTIYTCTKPTIAKVHGAAIGGANGLLASCDICVSLDDTVFSLSEVKIGIVPACISPYVVKRIGEMSAREMMLTGQIFNGIKAKELMLINFTGTPESVSTYINQIVSSLKTSGPVAMKTCKELLFNISNKWSLEEAKIETAKLIATLRASEEGQEGMQAFLQKRKPKWTS
jgi:methylglutaconyl-CoA hydratase